MSSMPDWGARPVSRCGTTRCCSASSAPTRCAGRQGSGETKFSCRCERAADSLVWWTLGLQVGHDSTNAVDLSDHADRDILLQFVLDLPPKVHDAVLGVDAELTSVQCAKESEVPFRETLDGRVVRWFDNLNQIGDTLIAERLRQRSRLGGRRRALGPPAKNDDAPDLHRPQSVNLETRG